ncbi:PVC-type heme-binding CxxCH protein [Novipirellula artificiosorum]|uniref:PVC-type heme-binding CxxCH protein n=1 Tax=Novipirellula artificiosorum TaxID=2528016 RepID=UPI001E49A33D|nr:PVC-type heme-binding CxxCH protein [Novipirellula artificiosorum]
MSILFVHAVTRAAGPLASNEPLQPDVAAASGEAQVAMSAVTIPENWTINLFASEPMVANIVAFDIDLEGRLFVAESYRQNRGVTDNRGHDDTWLLADLSAQTVQDRIDYHRRLLGDSAVTYTQHDDRIRRLIDADSDGKADDSVVFANGFHRLEEGTGAGVLARGNDVYYTCIPRLWKLSDRNGDGEADDRNVISDGYGVRVAFRGHDLHGLTMGPDGRLYFSVGDRGYHVTTSDGKVIADPATGAVFRCEMDGSSLEVFCNGLRNPQELAFNDLGDWFTVDNNSDSGDKARIVQLLQYGDSGWRMYYQYLPTRGPFNEDRLWEPWHPAQPAYIVPPIANFTDGPSGLAYYPGTGFSDEWKDRFLICDFRGAASQSGVRSFKLSPAGAFYKLESDDQPIWSVLATDVAFGPDGALYVSDWVDGWDGVGKGRIYRLTDNRFHDSPDVKEVAKLLGGDWRSLPTEDLVAGLAHSDRRIRLESQWELAHRRDTAVLLPIAISTDTPTLGRLHALWGADMVARVDLRKRPAVIDAIRPLMEDADPVIRAAAAKVVGERGDQDSVARLTNLLTDESSRVRYYATLSLAHLKAASAMPAVVQLLETNNDSDPALRHAGQVFLSLAVPAAQVATLSEHKSEAVRRSAVVALRRTTSGEVVRFLTSESPLVSAEAARAIHDAPIPLALQALASMIETPLANVPLLRRVINANYRIGSPEAAKALAKFAARGSNPELMRIEALDCLAEWDNVDPRDRVLGDVRQVTPRSRADAFDALSSEMEAILAGSETIREKAIEVAAKRGIKKVAPWLAMRVIDSNHNWQTRASALTGLAKLDSSKATELAKEVKLAPANELLEAALRVLADHDAAASIDTFIAATESRGTKVRQLAWDILATIEDERANEAISNAVRQYLEGTLASEVALNVLEAARDRLDVPTMEDLKEHQLSLRESDPLAPWLTSLHGGDAMAGKKLFFEKTELSCVRCHRIESLGGEVGPELTTIGKQKDARYLLESICLPNTTIAEKFGSMVIATDSGQVFTGIVKSETEEAIELTQVDGSLVQVAQEEIVALRSGKSAMPADLVQHLSGRELRDLVAYLSSLQTETQPSTDVQ